MTMQYNGDLTRRKLLEAAVGLFLGPGYHRTRVRDICEAAGVPNGSFYNAFSSKEGILYELVTRLFDSQFGKARALAGEGEPPLFVYALAASLQLAVAEQSENLRDIFMEAYTCPATAEYVYRKTAKETMRVFGPALPGAGEADFYEMDIASAGVMRGYMSVPCTQYFTLERKLRRFLAASFAIYGVPKSETARITERVLTVNMRPAAAQLTASLTEELRKDFSLEKSGN